MKIIHIVFATVTTILTSVAAIKWEKLTNLEQLALIFLIATIILAGLKDYRQTQKDYLKEEKEDFIEKINAIFGDISDLKEATIPILAVGKGATQFILVDGVFNFEQYPNIFKLYVKNKKLHFTTIIRDKEGEIIAAVYDNTWKMYQKGYEYNNDSNAFEIVTKGNLKVYFQVKLENGIAYIAGLIYSEKKFGLYIYDAPDDQPGAFLQVIPPDQPFDLPDRSINRIFKYPREKYIGVRNS